MGTLSWWWHPWWKKKKTITFLQKRSTSLIFQVSPHPFGLLFLPAGWKSFLAELPLTQSASCPMPVCVLVKRAVECEQRLCFDTPFTDVHWPSPCFVRKRLILVMISWLLFYEAIQLGGCPHHPTTLSSCCFFTSVWCILISPLGRIPKPPALLHGHVAPQSSVAYLLFGQSFFGIMNILRKDYYLWCQKHRHFVTLRCINTSCFVLFGIWGSQTLESAAITKKKKKRSQNWSCIHLKNIYPSLELP